MSLVRNSEVPKVVLELMTALWPEPLIELQLVRELNMVLLNWAEEPLLAPLPNGCGRITGYSEVTTWIATRQRLTPPGDLGTGSRHFGILPDAMGRSKCLGAG